MIRSVPRGDLNHGPAAPGPLPARYLVMVGRISAWLIPIMLKFGAKILAKPSMAPACCRPTTTRDSKSNGMMSITIRMASAPLRLMIPATGLLQRRFLDRRHRLCLDGQAAAERPVGRRCSREAANAGKQQHDAGLETEGCERERCVGKRHRKYGRRRRREMPVGCTAILHQRKRRHRRDEADKADLDHREYAEAGESERAGEWCEPRRDPVQPPTRLEKAHEDYHDDHDEEQRIEVTSTALRTTSITLSI